MDLANRILWFGILFCLMVTSAHNIPRIDLDILDGLLKNYDRRTSPTVAQGKPIVVTIRMYIRNFGSISPATMDYDCDLYLNQSWYDVRFQDNNISDTLYFSDPKVVQVIWKPEVFFPNAKDASFQMVTVPNIAISMDPKIGQITYMLRLKLTFSCMMDLKKFPLDRQTCSIELASFAKPANNLELRWADNEALKIFPGLKLPQFVIEKVETTNCREGLQVDLFGDDTTWRSCLQANIHLKRLIGYHLVQSYLPTTLIVVISWVSFWLEVDSIAARVTLGVTTLLTITSESAGIRSNLPPVSYVKAMDVWMGTCTTFVFAALIEFTCVNYLSRRKCKVLSDYESTQTGARKKKLRRKLTTRFSPCLPSVSHSHTNSPRTKRSNRGNVILAKKIDQFCRAIFPTLYALFSVLYWLYYT